MHRILFLLLLAITYLAAPHCSADEQAPEIRAFPIPTIVSLGKELYRRDHLAAEAFDALFEDAVGAKKQPLTGWVTELGEKQQRVYLMQTVDGKSSLAYVVEFTDDKAPRVTDQRGAAIPEAVAVRYHARQTAIAAVKDRLTRTYNFEVLDDPVKKGFLVYALASTNKDNEVIVGQHFRVSVSPDGEKVERIDALSRSMLILDKSGSDLPNGAKPVGFSMSHIVSPTPVETHVYVSLLHHIPLFVATSKEDVWSIIDGEIKKADAPATKHGSAAQAAKTEPSQP